MTAATISTARPKTAAICWVYKNELFVEYPVKDSPPYICRFRATTAGLIQALNLLVENPDVAPNLTATHPKIAENKAKAEKAAWASEQQRAATRDVLKRLKITHD